MLNNCRSPHGAAETRSALNRANMMSVPHKGGPWRKSTSHREWLLLESKVTDLFDAHLLPEASPRHEGGSRTGLPVLPPSSHSLLSLSR